MKNVKIQFSKVELRCMNDRDFLLRKRIITDKLCELLHGFAEILKASPVSRAFNFPAGVDFQAGRITRGENYKGLPYVILDFPRLFDKENIFAFRTMFWWGNYFSFTLHLKGEPLRQYRNSLMAHYGKLHEQGIHLYIGDDEWEHDLTGEQYLRMGVKARKIIREKGFLKLARKVDLRDYKFLFETGLETYENFIEALSG